MLTLVFNFTKQKHPFSLFSPLLSMPLLRLQRFTHKGFSLLTNSLCLLLCHRLFWAEGIKTSKQDKAFTPRGLIFPPARETIDKLANTSEAMLVIMLCTKAW